jgi:hypothetical protein
VWQRPGQELGEEAWIDEAIAPHQQEIAWHSQEGLQLERQGHCIMGHHMYNDIVGETGLLHGRRYGGHSIEVECTDAVFVEFFDVSHC